MMFGVHSTEEVGGGFVLGFGLLAAPVHEQTVAEATQHSHYMHRFGQAHTALVVQMADIQTQMQAVLNAPSGAIISQPLGGIQLLGRQAGYQRHGLGFMMAQVASQQGHLFDTREVDLFRASGAGAQNPCFQLPFVKLPAPSQSSGGLPRGKNAPEALELLFECWLG
jgi:hypothetical protein